LIFSCQNANKSEEIAAKVEQAPEPKIQQIVALPEITIVGEHHVNEAPLTDHPNAMPNQKHHEMTDADRAINYKTLHASDIQAMLTKSYRVVDKQSSATKPDAGDIVNSYPLDETQAYIAFNNEKWLGSIAVVSDKKSGLVEQIIFTDSTHQDVYNVRLGMTAKQVMLLRKELKLIEQEGTNYLYSEESNIMYLLDVKDANGKQHDELEMDKTTVSAIIWKDKNHQKHPKRIKNSPKKIS
jgi:hypothetical protein